MVVAVAVLLAAVAPRGYPTGSPIQAFALSPDGRRFACARDGNWFDLYDAETGAQVAHGRASDGDQITVLAFSPDGKTLAGGVRESSTVWLWDAATGDQHVSAAANGGGLAALVYSPDGTRLACGGYDGVVRVIDAENRSERSALNDLWDRDGGVVTVVVYHPNGGRVFSAGDDGGASIWRDGARPSCVDRFPKITGGSPVTAVAFHPTGRSAAVASDGSVRLVESATGKNRWFVKAALVCGLAASPDGRFVAGADGDGRLCVWDADDGSVVTQEHAHRDRCVSLAAGGGRVFTAGADQTVRAWRWPSARPVPPARLSGPERVRLLAALHGTDAVSAFAAVRRLSADPAAAVVLAGNDLHAVTPLSPAMAGEVLRLVGRLGADGFDDRQAATRKLAGFGPSVGSELRRALRASKDAEVSYRLEQVLQSSLRSNDPSEVTAARWLEVMERAGTPTAIERVRAVARGDPDHPRTEDAAETLARMGIR